jgi:hypothetical protein
MARRILNRHELREQAEQAARLADQAPDTTPAVVPPETKARRKNAAPPKPKKPRKTKAPPRLRARWGVFDAGMKQVAIFDYNQRAAAEEKVADLVARKKSLHFLQMVKEPMPDLEPAEVPSEE